MCHRLRHYIEGIVEASNEVGVGGGGGGESGVEGVEYLTYPSSYYPVPQTAMSFKDVRFMTPLPPDELSKGEEQAMKD